MPDNQTMRIAAFVTDFPIRLLGWLCDLIDGLAARGLEIDLFLYNSGAPPEMGSGICVIDLSDPTIVAAAARLGSANSAESDSAWVPVIEPFVPRHAVQIVHALAATRRYAYCLAFETRALLLARIGADVARCPLIHHSFELYEPAWPGVWREDCGRLREIEGRLLPSVDLLLIQEADRLGEYYRILGTSARPKQVMFMPVALPAVGGPAIRVVERPRYWHAKFGLSAATRVVLYVGQIVSGRLVDAMIRAAQRFGPERRLVLHGVAYDRSELHALQRLDECGRVLLSLETVGHRQLSCLCASADVGLAFYRADRPNEYHTGRSSDKLARYLQAGLPVICSDLPSFRREVDRYGFGRCCGDWNALPGHIEAVLGDYAAYRAGARRAFEAVYRLEPHLDRLVEWMRGQRTGTTRDMADKPVVWA